MYRNSGVLVFASEFVLKPSLTNTHQFYNIIYGPLMLPAVDVLKM